MAARSRTDAPSADDGIRLTVAAVAARLGVAAPTLRTWDRRYGLGPSGHAAGSHRRYNASDISRLETMRRLTLEGMAPADAARLATRGGLSAVESAIEVRDGSGPRGRRAAPEADRLPGSDLDDGPTLEIVDPLSLAAAAVESDEGRVRRLVRRAAFGTSILGAWRTLVLPALELLAGRDHADRPGHDPEFVLRGAMLAAVREFGSTTSGSSGDVLVLAEPAMHVEAHVLAGELSHRGLPARVVRPRARTVADAVAVVHQRGMRLVVLLGEPDGAGEVAADVTASGEHVFVIAHTRTAADLPDVHRARTLAGAVHEIESLLSEVPHTGNQAGDG
ncbi:MerR family transcriptional regulator [Occultella gossypii]|uniref:MerR family transcriptional regulator n=1 Tax=Occultella gossypii TaxID=2800820 RepID=A0ABS7SBM1_9MICO|nr:MerR family transcriptional regulator [Occultella gossypii]MBZ2197749.1 MerR family transcriptional regulator [Occultella gossypii]